MFNSLSKPSWTPCSSNGNAAIWVLPSLASWKLGECNNCNLIALPTLCKFQRGWNFFRISNFSSCFLEQPWPKWSNNQWETPAANVNSLPSWLSSQSDRWACHLEGMSAWGAMWVYAYLVGNTLRVTTLSFWPWNRVFAHGTLQRRKCRINGARKAGALVSQRLSVYHPKIVSPPRCFDAKVGP